MNVLMHTMLELDEIRKLELGALRPEEDARGGFRIRLVNPEQASQFRQSFKLPVGLTGRPRLELTDSCRASLDGNSCTLHWYRGGPLVNSLDLAVIEPQLQATTEWSSAAVIVWETIDQVVLTAGRDGLRYELRRWRTSLDQPCHWVHLDYNILGAGIWTIDLEHSADCLAAVRKAHELLERLPAK